MHDRLFVAWQDEVSRTWHTIARLTRTADGYEFVFTRGASRLKSVPENLFGMQLHDRFQFSRLIPLFTNRIPSRTRTDFGRMAAWLDLDEFEQDPFTLLARFGLIPGTDSILIYPEPSVANGRYTLDFFVHGIRHMHRDASSWCDSVVTGDRLLPLLDVQNPVDPDAVTLRAEGSYFLIGYVPAFYSRDVRTILFDYECAESARLTVRKSNADAPMQLRILCRFEADVPVNFLPLDDYDHQPLEPVNA